MAVWCACARPVVTDEPLRCGGCGGLYRTTPEQDHETAMALARVILGGRLKTN